VTLEEAKALRWGTFGKGVVEECEISGTPLPVKPHIKPLGELDDEHLKNIFCHQKHISDEYREAIRMILKERSGAWLEIEEQRPFIRRREAIEATKAKSKV
jgi:hypothetical protein